MSNRDRIRFMEIFKDFSEQRVRKDFFTIPKREFNPEISTFANLALDLVDFRDRVRPMARDLTLMESASRYQKMSPKEFDDV